MRGKKRGTLYGGVGNPLQDIAWSCLGGVLLQNKAEAEAAARDPLFAKAECTTTVIKACHPPV